jgi:hypothetical protein
MSFLKDFVYCNESFEGLHFIGENWLPVLELALPPCNVIFHVFAKKLSSGLYGKTGVSRGLFGLQ